MTSSEHIKAQIRNKSKVLNLNANIILRNIIFEFFLEKLAKSNYVNRFVIKGGFLVSAITQIDLRTTMDLDVTLKSLSIEKDDLSKYLIEILSISTHENLSMELLSIDEIHEHDDYPGLRASISVQLDGLRELIKIDFTTGDILTPSEINFNYKTLLDGRIINLKSYNIETILAEKIETILSRGILNTRMRDFYDVYILIHLNTSELDYDTLSQAFKNTARYRKSLDNILPNYKSILSSIEQDNTLIRLWKSYQNNFPFAKDVKWICAIKAVKTTLEMIEKHN